MKLVIRISEEEYDKIKENDCGLFSGHIYQMIRNGTLIPKGHGDLVDRDGVNDRFYGIWKELESYPNQPSQKVLLDKWSMCMDTAPVIIKADESESEDNE